ncbi:MAG: SET domain-containing protein [Candidatus Moraniibacteriota bacterium]
MRKKDLKKGEIIFLLKGPYKTYSKITKEELYNTPNWIGIDRLVWIDPKTPADKINHSCNPNVGIRGRKQFVAMRNIKKGEELSF